MMRKLSPPKAIGHAFNSVVTYRREAARIGMFWIPVLFLIGVARALLGTSSPDVTAFEPADLIEIVSTAVGLMAFSSMAVNWHRFILCDEHSAPWRIDALVLRYAGNSLLIVVMVALPVLLALGLSSLVPVLSIIMLPVSILAGTFITALSVKLPAVALGRKDFTFMMAWEICKGNFWQILGVFLLNAAAILGVLLVVILLILAVQSVNDAAGQVVALVADAAMGLFLALFNASVFTSLYGFFVERRDF